MSCPYGTLWSKRNSILKVWNLRVLSERGINAWKKEFFRARLLPGQEQVQLLEPLVYPPVKYEQLLQKLL